MQQLSYRDCSKGRLPIKPRESHSVASLVLSQIQSAPCAFSSWFRVSVVFTSRSYIRKFIKILSP